TEVEDGEWRLCARCDGAFARHGLRVEDQVDASPLLRPLRRTGIPWLTLNLIHRRVPLTRYSPGGGIPDVHASEVRYFYPIDVARDRAAALRFAVGYCGRDILRTLGPLALLLLLPVFVTLRLRARALGSQEADPSAVWFRFARSFRWLIMAGFPVWIAA